VLIPAFSRSFPDTTRGVLNEGGLFGERAGWHLPGFDTSSWVKRDLSAGLPDGAAGVGFFVTTFPLNIPAGFDVMLSFTFNESFQPYRAFLFVNGWMMGKRVANLGCAVFTNLRPRTGTLLTHTRTFRPQFKFPVHQGILDYNGTKYVILMIIYVPTIDVGTCYSTIAVALWAMEAVPIVPALELTIDTVLEGGVGPIICNNPAWSPEGREIKGQSNNGRV